MPLEADVIVDRRRMRRKLTFWRVMAFFALAVLVVVSVAALTDGGDWIGKKRSHVARLSYSGLIMGDRASIELVEKVAKSDGVKGVVLSIDSPGGTAAGSEALYTVLRQLAEKKPVVAHIRSVGASGGYMIALAADHIVAWRGGITGSIGVVLQYGEISKLLESVGISIDEVKSSPLKAAPSWHEPASPEARAVLEITVNDMYDWFVGLVAERRQLGDTEARRLADGRIYTGSQAASLGLIDAVGAERDAIKWLEDEREVASDLPVRDWTPEVPATDVTWVEAFADAVVKAVIGSEAGVVRQLRRRVVLDGLLAVWQAPPTRNGSSSEGAIR